MINPNKLVLAATALLAANLPAQLVQPPYSGHYTTYDLGTAPGIPGLYGGITFRPSDPSKLLIGGNANYQTGAVFEIDVVRDAQGAVVGFSGTGTQIVAAPVIDGGLCFGPGGVLFYTAFQSNTLNQVKPGSSTVDKTINLYNAGVTSSTGSCNFVPANFPGAGELKITSYYGGCWGFDVTPDGNGTFDISLQNGPVPCAGGPEGILHVPPGSNLIPDYSKVVVAEYNSGDVVIYDIDNDGNPVHATRQVFVAGVGRAFGACVDPITGDLFFVGNQGTSRVVRVSGFGVCGSFQGYGTGIDGSNGAPGIAGSGCAGRGQVMSIDVSNGLAGTSGLLAVGFRQAALPFLNGQLLVDPTTTFFHVLDGVGEWNLTLQLPVAPIWNGLNIYSQSFYVDAAAGLGVAATRGLHTLVR